MARAADTNVIVRLLVRDDPQQVALAQQAGQLGLWVSHVVLVEVAWVLQFRFGKTLAQVAVVIEGLIDNARLTIENPEVVTAAVGQMKANRRIDFADAMIVEMARRAGVAPLLTFDRALSKVDGAELIKR
jgi:predicted nucleic-acid-binding protein